jgi:VCBS repeat-containing protein
MSNQRVRDQFSASGYVFGDAVAVTAGVRDAAQRIASHLSDMQPPRPHVAQAVKADLLARIDHSPPDGATHVGSLRHFHAANAGPALPSASMHHNETASLVASQFDTMSTHSNGLLGAVANDVSAAALDTLHDMTLSPDASAAHDVIHQDSSLTMVGSHEFLLGLPGAVHAAAETRGSDAYATTAPASAHGGAPPPPTPVTVGGQLWFGVDDGNNTHSGLDHVDTDAAGYDVADHPTSGGVIASMALDGADGLYFAYGRDEFLRSGHITNDIESGQASEIQETDMVFGTGANADEVNAIAIDPLNHILFVGLFGQSDQYTGILEVTYNPTTGALTNPYNASTGVVTDFGHMLFHDDNNGHVNGSGVSATNIVAMQYDMQNGLLYYVDQSNGYSSAGGSGFNWNATNGVYVVSTSGSVGGGTAPTPTLLTLNSQFAAGDNNNYIEGMTINEAQGLIYLAVNNASNSTSKLFWMPIAGGTATQMSLPSGVNAFFIDDQGTGVNPIAFDPNLRQLYVSDNSHSQLTELTLSADGKSFSSGVADFQTIDHVNPGTGPTGLYFDPLPALSALTATSTEALQGGSALQLLTANPTITDPQDGVTNKLHMGYLQITIANAQAGDNLFYQGAQNGTFDSGKMSISWNSSTHTLTLTGNETEAFYDTLFTGITYQDGGTDTTTVGSHPTRTIDWVISDGTTIVDQTTADPNERATTVTIDRAPVLGLDNYAVLKGATSSGTSGTGGTGVFHNDTDLDGDSFTITAVNGVPGNVGNSVSGTYGELTLNADGSYSYVADQATAIDNAATGSHPIDSFTYTASDGLGGVTTQTVEFTIDRAPTVVADNPSGEALESGSAITGNVLTNDSDKDGDSLTVSAFKNASNVSGTLGSPLAGVYGHLTVNANGTYSYSADNTSAIDAAATGSHLTDTFSYTADDGHGGTTTTTITLMIDRAPVAVADASTSDAVESGTTATGNVLTNDTDPDADTLSVSAVAGVAGNVGHSVAGTYGHITINSDGSYTYTADNTAAIDAAATGSHLTDTFTYTASDGQGGTNSNQIVITLDRAPTVVADAASALESGSAATGNVLTNDSDRDGDSLVVSAVAGSAGNVGASVAGTYGHLTLNSDGSYSYVADNTTAIDAAATGSHLTDTFSYTASDGQGGTTTTNLVITLDRAPTTVDDSAGVAEGDTVSANAANGVLANDSDRDGDVLTVVAVKGMPGKVGTHVSGAYGHLTLNADGSYSYVADRPTAINNAPTGSHPVDTFTFTVSDGHGGTTDETVSFTIDRPAVAHADAFSTAEDTAAVAGTVAAGVLGNDVDPDTNDNTGITVTAVNGSAADVGTQILLASGALLTLNADGTYTYDPNHAFDYLPASGSGAKSTATDTFTYTINSGQTVTVTVTINGVDSNDTLVGTSGNDTFSGGIGADTFLMQAGGNDTVNGDSGNDVFYFDGTFTAADQVDGGGGNDRLSLNGDYSAGVVFNAGTLVNVERIGLVAGHSYNLTTDDATVAAGKTLAIGARTLGAGDQLTFDGSAETDGNFVIRAGAGDDVLTGGAGADVFRLKMGGDDTAHGGGGNDTFFFRGAFTAADQVDGGTGVDRLALSGDYSGGVTFNATTMTNVEKISLDGGHSYALTLNDANVAAGQNLSVNGSGLGAGDHFNFDGSAETDGTFTILGGAGNDTLTGGAGDDVIFAGDGTNTITGGGGRDILTGGTGADTFVYNNASDSTSTTHDVVKGFDASADFFDVSVAVTGVDATVASGTLRGAHFDTDLAAAVGASQLAADHAVLFTPTAGAFAGHTILVVDQNGVAGYQAGQDLVIDLQNAVNLGLTTGNFI